MAQKNPSCFYTQGLVGSAKRMAAVSGRWAMSYGCDVTLFTQPFMRLSVRRYVLLKRRARTFVLESRVLQTAFIHAAAMLNRKRGHYRKQTNRRNLRKYIKL